MATTVWGDRLLSDGSVQHVNVGDLHCWLKYRDEEIWIAYVYPDEIKGKPKADKPPAGIEWSRWAHKSGSPEVNISPVFPDKPLVVHSEYNLKVSPDTRIQIFTRIPIWIRISLAKKEYQLIEMPAIKLSRTWFGTFTEGELCYHATTKARRDLSQTEKKPYLVSCPIKIINRSEEELTFAHFCLRVERLSTYLYNDELWADEIQITYQGEDLNSDVIMTGKLPEGISKKNLLTKPRKQIQKSLATRTFKLFFRDTPSLQDR